jgi:hypothetical protein
MTLENQGGHGPGITSRIPYSTVISFQAQAVIVDLVVFSELASQKTFFFSTVLKR